LISTYKEFEEMVRSKAFHLFDDEAKARVLTFKNKLDLIPKLLMDYDKKRYLGYQNKASKQKGNPDPKRYDAAKAVIGVIDEAFTEMFQYIRQYYHEIDTNLFHLYKDEEENPEVSPF
jgi:hypothetical protein